MSPDGAFFTYEDLVAFVQKHRLPYTEEVLFSMFSEANSTSDGMMDMDQLQKASNFKFQNRRHNHDWVGLFQLAPREPGTRVTALSPRLLEQVGRLLLLHRPPVAPAEAHRPLPKGEQHVTAAVERDPGDTGAVGPRAPPPAP